MNLLQDKMIKKPAANRR